MFSDSNRQFYRCGQIDSSKWTDDSRTCPVPGDGPDDVDCCPGYLVQLPQVHDAARASAWRSDGVLDQYFDGVPLTQIAKDSIDIIMTEARLVESYAMRKASEVKRG